MKPTFNKLLYFCISSIFILVLGLNQSLGQACTFSERFEQTGSAYNHTFGKAVSAYGYQVVVGAPNDSGSTSLSGSAYVYDWDGTSWMVEELNSSTTLDGDLFGYAVDLADERMIVGAPATTNGNINSTTRVGSASIFMWDGTIWVEHLLIPSDGQIADGFGSSVSIQGDRAIVASRFADPNGTASGAIYIYDFNGTSWIETTKLVASDGVNNDQFGFSVALFDDRILVGAINDDENGFSNSGSAYIFEWDGTSWVETKILAADGGDNHYFGSSVNVLFDRVIVGAYGATGNVANSGAAYIFEWDGTAWSETEKLFDPSGSSSDQYGLSVDIDLDQIAVGARWKDDGSDQNVGEAFLYVYDGTDWVENSFTPSDGDASYTFGESVAISVDVFVSGAPGVSDLAPDAGAAYMFVSDGTTWTEYRNEPADYGNILSFGKSVAIDNDRMVVGANQRLSTGQAFGPGKAWLYEYDGSTWNEQEFNPTNGQFADNYGAAVSISGDRFVVGAPFDDDQANNAGAVYIYDYDGTNWVETKLFDSDVSGGGNFGLDVALSGDKLIVGAGGSRAYIYHWNGTSWDEEIITSSGGTFSGFGLSVDIQDDRAIIGAYATNNQFNADGAALIFDYDGTSWTQSTILYPSNPSNTGNFGLDVAIAEDKVMIGGSLYADKVWFFNYDGTNWNETEFSVSLNGSSNPVAMHGNNAVLGSDFSIIGDSYGEVHTFQWHGACWIQGATISSDAPYPGAKFGHSVAMGDDRMLIGTQGFSDHVELWDCIEDPTGPTAICHNALTLPLDNTGNVTILPTDLDAGSSSPCGIASMSVSPDVFDCTQLGVHTVTLTVVGNNGEQSTCSTEVTITDITPPEIYCTQLTIQLPPSGIVTITEADVDGGTMDNCGSFTLSLSQTTFNCMVDGNYPPYVLTATDDSGNTSSCDLNLILIESTMPEIYCQDITVHLDDSGQVTVNPFEVQQTVVDPLVGFVGLEGADYNICNSGDDQYDPVLNTMTLAASDLGSCGGGGANDCNEVSHIYQTIVPSSGEVCFEYNISDLGAGDIFAYSKGVDWSIIEASFANLQAMTTSIADSATGTVGSNVTFCVDVVAGENFSLLVYTDYFNNGSSESWTFNGVLEATDATADWDLVDDCTPYMDTGDGVDPGPGQTYYDVHIFNPSCEVEYNITMTSDWGDSQAYLYETFINPSDICEHLIAWDGDSGPGYEANIDIVPVNGLDYYLYISTWSVGQVGNYTIEVSNGSFGPGAFTVDINNITIASSISSDNCLIASETLSPNVFDCSMLGTNVATFTASDSYGNTASCNINIEVLDDTTPSILCKDITVQLDANGEATILPEDVQDFPIMVPQDFIPLAGANCAGAINSFDPISGEMTLTASDSDIYGGSGSNPCTFWAHIYQYTFPSDTEICFDWEVVTAGVGDRFGYSVSLDWTVDVAHLTNLNAEVILLADSDNPGGPGITTTCVSGTAGTPFALVVYTDYFANGNSFGFGALTVDINNFQIPDTFVDNCDVNLSLDISDFTCDEIGSNTVVLTATDASGNAASCSANVEVEDQMPPVAITQDLTIDLDSDGNAVITAAMVDNGSFDNCNIDIMGLDITSFTCAEVPGVATVPYSSSLVNTINTSTNFVNDLTIYNDLIYCSQRPLDEIKVFDMAGVLQFSFGTAGAGVGEFGEPKGIAFDSGGNIYVSDRSSSKVLKFDPTGTFISEFSTPNIEDIFILNDVLYAALDNAGKVSTYDLAGNLIQDLFNFTGVTSIFIANNKIYVCDNNSSSTFKVFDLSGTELLSIAVGGWANDISADSNGYIYLARWNDGIHDIYDESGTLVHTGTPSILASTFYNGQFFGSSISGDFYTFDVDYGDPGGYNNVVLTVTDQQGLSSTATAKITVQDVEIPTVSCQDITVQVAADGTPTTVAGMDVDDDSTDNCGIASYDLDVSTFTINEKGINPVILTVTDESGNTATCSAEVTVVCACDPASSTLIPNTAAGLHTAEFKYDDGQFTHYCDSSERLLLSIDSPTASSIPPSEVTINITPGGFYYEQYCTGSGGSEDGSCFIENADGAVVLCRSWDVDNASTDAVVRFYFDQVDLDIVNSELYNLGLDPMTDPNQMWFYKVVNGTGHQKPDDLSTADVSIIDNDGSGIPSTTNWAIGMAASAYYAEYEVSSFSGGGGGGAQGGSSPLCPIFEASIIGDEVLTAAGTSDVYIDLLGGVAPYTVNLSDGTMVSGYNSGDPISVTFTETTTYTITSVYDSDNCPTSFSSGTATKYVSTGDVTPPVAVCQNVTVELSAYGTASISVSDIDNGSSDNEGIATISIDNMVLDCNSPSIVTLTVTDISGNTDQCTATITINDPLNVCCPTDRSISYAPSIAKEYQADQNIDTDAEIKNGTGITNIIMHAGTQICLEPGFEVELGAEFEVYIGPCN